MLGIQWDMEMSAADTSLDRNTACRTSALSTIAEEDANLGACGRERVCCSLQCDWSMSGVLTACLLACCLAATKAWKKLVTDRAEVEGLPASALALAAQQAASDAKKVPVLWFC